jgi:hypothetical protein
MRIPVGDLRVSCLVASAAAPGYFWRGALEATLTTTTTTDGWAAPAAAGSLYAPGQL